MDIQLENRVQQDTATDPEFVVGFPIGHGPDAAELLILGGSKPKSACDLAARAKRQGSDGMYMLTDRTTSIVTALSKTSDGEWRAYKVNFADGWSSFEGASAVATQLNQTASTQPHDSKQWMVFRLRFGDGRLLDVVTH